MLPDTASALVALGARVDAAGVTLADAAALRTSARTLADEGRFRWRAEEFDVRSEAGDAVLGTVDRGALPTFGIRAHGVHINGLVRRADGLHVWIARRRDDRPLDPGKLDHLAAGGIPAGLGAGGNRREGGAGRGRHPGSAGRARRAGLHPATTRSSVARACGGTGCSATTSTCLPISPPRRMTRRWPDSSSGRSPRRCAAVAETDDFKFNVNLVLIDLFLRKGLVDPASEAGRRLREGLGAG